jgi:hypothetical protein
MANPGVGATVRASTIHPISWNADLLRDDFKEWAMIYNGCNGLYSPGCRSEATQQKRGEKSHDSPLKSMPGCRGRHGWLGWLRESGSVKARKHQCVSPIYTIQTVPLREFPKKKKPDCSMPVELERCAGAPLTLLTSQSIRGRGYLSVEIQLQERCEQREVVIVTSSERGNSHFVLFVCVSFLYNMFHLV